MRLITHHEYHGGVAAQSGKYWQEVVYDVQDSCYYYRKAFVHIVHPNGTISASVKSGG